MWIGLGFGLNLIWAKLDWAWLYGLGLAILILSPKKSYKMHCMGFEPMTFRLWDKLSTTRLNSQMIMFLHCFTFIQIYYMMHAL